MSDFKPVFLVEARNGVPRRAHKGFLVPVFMAVARRKMGVIKKGEHIIGLWDYTRDGLEMVVRDWAANNDIPNVAKHVGIIKAYACAYDTHPFTGGYDPGPWKLAKGRRLKTQTKWQPKWRSNRRGRRR